MNFFFINILYFLFLFNINGEKISLKVEDPSKEKVLVEKLSSTEYNWYFYFKDKNHLHLITTYQIISLKNNKYYFTKSTNIYHFKSNNEHKCPVIIHNLSYRKYEKYMNNFYNY